MPFYYITAMGDVPCGSFSSRSFHITVADDGVMGCLLCVFGVVYFVSIFSVFIFSEFLPPEPEPSSARSWKHRRYRVLSRISFSRALLLNVVGNPVFVWMFHSWPCVQVFCPLHIGIFSTERFFLLFSVKTYCWSF